MKPTGIVFLYNRNIGSPKDVSKKFSQYFADMTENLVKEGLLDLPALKEIIDLKSIFWGGISKDFDKVLGDSEAIGSIAWKIFYDHTKREASDDIKSLVFEESAAPWKFSLIVCVLQE